MTRKVIAYEDDPALRKQVENIFYAIREDFKLLASFEEPSAVSEQVSLHQPDVVIMDIQMNEEEDGLNALYRIKKDFPLVKVMMLTTFDIDDKIFNAICLGADGYMLKTDFSSFQMPHEAMRRSLRILFEGGAYLTPAVAKRILNLFSDQTIAEKILKVKEKFQSVFQKQEQKSSREPLTRMQAAVLRKIVDGKTTNEIAREFSLTENTINTHIKAVYSALEVHSRSRAIKKALEEKWIA